MPQHQDLYAVGKLLAENTDKILTASGMISLVAGVLLLSGLPSVPSILCIFFGLALTATGLLSRIGAITHDGSRMGKAGVLLIVTSVILLAGSFSCLLFRDIARAEVVVPFGTLMGTKPKVFEIRVAQFSYPLAWLVEPLFLTGLGSLVAGIVLKQR